MTWEYINDDISFIAFHFWFSQFNLSILSLKMHKRMYFTIIMKFALEQADISPIDIVA